MARTEFRKRGERVSLDKIPTEPPKGITKEKARERFAALGEELFELQDALWGAKVNSVMVVLQGRDTAGKDGTIKHVAGCLNPRGVQVASFGVPTVRGAAARLPVAGASPRAAARRILHLQPLALRGRAGGARARPCAQGASGSSATGTSTTSRSLLAEHGTIVLKYFLHISQQGTEEAPARARGRRARRVEAQRQ